MTVYLLLSRAYIKRKKDKFFFSPLEDHGCHSSAGPGAALAEHEAIGTIPAVSSLLQVTQTPTAWNNGFKPTGEDVLLHQKMPDPHGLNPGLPLCGQGNSECPFQQTTRGRTLV